MEVREDLDIFASVLEEENDKITQGRDAFSEGIQRNRGRVEKILKNCFDLRHI